MVNLIVALWTASTIGLVAPDCIPKAEDAQAFSALVEHLVEQKFPTSHQGRGVAIDLGSIAQELGGASVTEVRRMLEEKRPVESLGADPTLCRQQKCWKSSMYISLKSWEPVASGYEAVVSVVVRHAEGYSTSVNRYSLARNPSGQWTATLTDPVLRS